MTAALGIGGGILLLAVMIAVMPTPAVIPIHAVVQLGSNFGRFALMRKHVRWSLFGVISVGAIIGVGIGGIVVVELPGNFLRVLLACFILWTVWAPKISIGKMGYGQAFLGGIGASFLTMFVGATGAFILAILRSFGLDRLAIVATHAATMSAQHGFKIVAFGLLGFAFTEWIPLVVAMIGGGLLGTVVGKRLLIQTPEARFRTVLKWLLTAISAWLIVRSAIQVLTA